jgi:hypothetical protein
MLVPAIQMPGNQDLILMYMVISEKRVILYIPIKVHRKFNDWL